MRPPGKALALAGLVAFSFGGCRMGMCSSESKSARPLQWTSIAADDVEVTPLRRSTRFAVTLPPEASPARRIEIRFPRPLEAARVEALGTGPNHAFTRLHETRVRGNTLAFETPSLTLLRLDLVVHHHLRPSPLPPEVRVGREVRP
jgi:hypothetical protein